jgi:hypothetical protein
MQWSDDDDDDEDDDRITPRVTRLEAPSSISCTATGEIVIHEQNNSSSSSSSAKPLPSNKAKDDKAPASFLVATAKETAPKPESTTEKSIAFVAQHSKDECSSSRSIPASWTEKGSVCEITTTSPIGNVSQKTQLYWSQDRSTVTFRFALIAASPLDSSSSSYNKKNEEASLVRGWNCRVPGILSYDNRTSAIGTTGDKPRLILTHSNKNNVTLSFFDGELPYPVHLAQDDDQVDWSIERIESPTLSSILPPDSNNSVPFLCVTLFKATPMAGMVLWWNRPFTTCPELAQMEWRKSTTDHTTKSGGGGGGTAGAESSFQQAWDEAHRLFKEKRLQERDNYT